MFILIYIGVIIITYILTFQNDFTPEHLEKAGPFIFIVCSAIILLGIAGSLIGG